jgi:hypothetical protein
VEIVELSAAEARGAAAELGRLLLDAHASNMALGLAGPPSTGRGSSACGCCG